MESFEKRNERGISNMGELLLKGYIMSAEACPECNCPMFKKSSYAPLFCPLCDDKDNKKEQNEVEVQKKIKESEFSKEIKMKINENNLKKKDSVNSKMSELLLAGWTLTNDNCPLCIGIPLMKNKEKQQFCVKCENHFINEKEAKKQGMSLNNERVDNIKQKEKEISVQPETRNKIIKHSLENEDEVVQLSLNKDTIPPTKKEKTDSIAEETKLECSKTSTVLLHQLSYLRSKLEVINENNDIIPNIQNTINICDAISSVVNALNVCNSLLKN